MKDMSSVQNIIKEEVSRYLLSGGQLDETTLDFIDGVISENEYLSENLDENILKKGFDFVVNKLLSILSSAFSNMSKLGKKAIVIAKKAWSIVNKFCDRNGNLCKVAVVLIIIFLVNTGTAYAAATGDGETPKMIYDAAIGFLEQNADLFQDDYGTSNFMQAKSILYGIRDQAGDITSMDDPDLAATTDKAQMLAKHALNFMENMAKEAKGDPEKMKEFFNYIQKGKQLILKSQEVVNTTLGG